MKFFLTRRWLGLVLLTAMGAGIYLGSAFSPGLFNGMDAFYARVSREMVLTGDWITPKANGVRYFEKPPMLYWLTAISFRFLGVSEFSARFPTRVLAVGTILLTFLIGELLFGRAAGLYAALFLGTSVGFYVFSFSLRTDPALTFFLTGALFFWLRGYLRASANSYLLCHLFVALAVLTKGLVDLVFLAIIIGSYLIITRQLYRIREMRLILGGLIILGVAAPWYILVGVKNSGFFWFYFVNEHFYRFLGWRYPPDYGNVPLVNFWFLHLAWLFPWSFFFPLIAKGLNSLRGLAQDRARLSLFILVWALVVPLFFSFTRREEHYTMPAFPALALLLGAFLSHGPPPLELGHKKALVYSHFALLCLAGVLFVIIQHMIFKPGDFWLTRMIQVLNPGWLRAQEGGYYVYFSGPLNELKGQFQTALAGPMLATGWALPLGASFSYIFCRREKIPLALLGLFLAMGVVIFSIHRSLVIFEPYLSSKSLALVINRTWQPGDKVVIEGGYELFSSVGFYVKEPVLLLNGQKEDLYFGSLYPDSQGIFINESDFLSLWESGRRVYLVTLAESNPAFGHPGAGSPHLLGKSGNRLLFSNRP